MRLILFGLLDKPVLLHGSRAVLRLALNLRHLALVARQLLGKIGFFGACRGLRDGKLLDVAVGIGGLDGRGFICLQFLEVEILDEVGWWMGSARGLEGAVRQVYVPLRIDVVMKVRALDWRTALASVWR